MRITPCPVVQKPSSHDRREDQRFKRWIQKQPSCIDGVYSEFVNGEGRSVACHVRRVSGGAGIANKPLFNLVPMTHQQHLWQHTVGELALLKHYGILCINEQQAKEWFEEKVEHYLKMWRASV